MRKLFYRTFNLLFILSTDSSGYGVGTVLLQYLNLMPFPVSYASRVRTPISKTGSKKS